LGLINAILLLFTYILESNVFFKKEIAKSIIYENIELVKAENREALMEDLRKRTGLKITRIAVNRIDFLKDTANIKVYYYE